MPNNILLKKSSQTGKVPLVGDLSYGELALNYNDGRLYYKTSDNEIKYFISTATTATLFINNPTAAVSTDTGALVVGGGVGIVGDLYVGGTLVTNTPISTVQSVLTTSSNTVINATNSIVLANGTITLTLPDATVNTGRTFTIKNVGVGRVTVVTSTATQFIDGDTTWVLQYQNSAFNVTSDGTNWAIT